MYTIHTPALSDTFLKNSILGITVFFLITSFILFSPGASAATLSNEERNALFQQNGLFTGSYDIPDVLITDTRDILFRDISVNWAEADIQRLVIRGIIDNVAYFHPHESLSRAEFLKIIINTAGWIKPSLVLNVAFNDVSSESWYSPYVSVGISRGLLENTTLFRPNDPITRAEASMMLMKSLGISLYEPMSMPYSDVNMNSDFAKYIEGVIYLNIFSGQLKNGNRIFRPYDSISRSEIAKVVVNTFSLE